MWKYRYLTSSHLTGANAIVVITAAGVVAVLKKYNVDEISTTDKVDAGLPPFAFPKFSAEYPNLNVTITTSEIFEVSTH